QEEGRMDITSARTGTLAVEGTTRYLTLDEGFRVEGPTDGGKDFRLMRYASNQVRLPDAEARDIGDDPELMSTIALLGDTRAEARAQVHFRLSPPLLALAFALLAVPLARSPPRQARWGRIIVGLLAYVFGINLMLLGTNGLASGRLPVAAGLWWLVLPLLALGLWMDFDDGRVRRPRRAAAWAGARDEAFPAAARPGGR